MYRASVAVHVKCTSLAKSYPHGGRSDQCSGQVELLHGWGGAEAEIQRRSDSPFRWTHFPIRLEYYPRIRNGPHSARFNGLPAGYDSGSCSRSLAFWDILGRTPNWVFDGHCTRGSVSAPCRVFFSTDSNACSNAPYRESVLRRRV